MSAASMGWLLLLSMGASALGGLRDSLFAALCLLIVIIIAAGVAAGMSG